MDELKFEDQFLFYLEHIAPTIGVNQQTVYLYFLGQSIRDSSNDIIVSVKTSRKSMGMGTGDAKKPMAENTVIEAIQKLVQHGLIERTGSGRKGTFLRVVFPMDAIGFHPEPFDQKSQKIEDIDFFNDPSARRAIVVRENNQCFYCLSTLVKDGFVMEYVVSRPHGNNSYTNIVAACNPCNNRKKDRNADVFLRSLYRDGLLDAEELKHLLQKIEDLRNGKLVPRID